MVLNMISCWWSIAYGDNNSYSRHITVVVAQSLGLGSAVILLLCIIFPTVAFITPKESCSTAFGTLVGISGGIGTLALKFTYIIQVLGYNSGACPERRQPLPKESYSYVFGFLVVVSLCLFVCCFILYYFFEEQLYPPEIPHELHAELKEDHSDFFDKKKKAQEHWLKLRMLVIPEHKRDKLRRVVHILQLQNRKTRHFQSKYVPHID